MSKRLLFLVLGLILACSDEPAGGEVPIDIVQFADSGVDTPGPDTPAAPETSLVDGGSDLGDEDAGGCPGAFGCPCEASADCDSGWCIPTATGQVCTTICDECPTGWTCKGVTGGSDITFLCVPVEETLCKPCLSDDQCGGSGATCVPDATGAGRCGKSCSGAADCPSGFDCTSSQCVPTSGLCACSELLIGQSQACTSSNEYGTCSGKQICAKDGWTTCDAPAAEAETCNGHDDNCDGAIDEAFEGLGAACDSDDEDLCANGLLACDESGASVTCQDDSAAVEQCDGLDNDCDGEVDEGSPDLDGDEAADCVDDDDDADGDPDATDCAAHDPTVFTGAVEACDGEDQDCDGVADNGFPDLDADGLADCADPDFDGDGVANAADNCPGVPNLDQLDLDGDGTGDACDTDDDGDLVPDATDNCPKLANPAQTDFDADGLGDACDPDDDDDGAADAQDCNPFDASVKPGAAELCNGIDDNCNGLFDEGSLDTDQDDLANCVDPDDDNDGVPDDSDCAPLNAAISSASTEICNGVDDDCDAQIDEGFADTDDDGLADCVDPDDDEDGVPDAVDNCPLTANPAQKNADADGAGDACDTDDDNDGALDGADCAPTDPAVYPDAKEACNGKDDDCDGEADDGFPNADEDELADCVDEDDDNDGVPDALDNCPKTANGSQKNSDSDLLGDACDTDDDNDDALDPDDCEPANAAVYPGAKELCNGSDDDCDGDADEGFPDSDGDGTPDCLSEDDDGDGIPDAIDNCPKLKNAGQENADGDPLGDACDPDDDNDSVPDATDCAPFDKAVYPGAKELCNGADEDCDEVADNGFADTDGDGAADCVDNDDDGDGVVDAQDNCPLVANDQTNSDNDLLGDACDADDDNDGTPDGEDCAPTNPAVSPKAQEVCDGIDQTCDGVADEGFADTDQDLVADCVDPDDDGDGLPDAQDNCPLIANASQANHDGDLQGDACDADDDNDGAPDGDDCAPNDAAVHPGAPETCNGADDDCDGLIDEGFTDTDGDLAADCVDSDDDGDGISDLSDNCPAVANADQKNGDSDLMGDACDADDDNDGDPDATDCATLNPAIHAGAVDSCDGVDNDCSGKADDAFPDTDGDLLADCVDGDDDGDGDPDALDCAPLDEKVFHGAVEVCGNNIDDDCDPSTACYTAKLGNKSVTVTPYPGPKGAVSWYSYGVPNGSSANTGLEQSQKAIVFLYTDPTDGKTYLMVILDKVKDGSGGKFTAKVTGALGATVVLMDDPGEGSGSISPATGAGTLTWTWAPCCTDGAVIGPLKAPFCVSMAFSGVTGITTIATMDGTKAVDLGAPTAALTLCAQP